MKTIFGSMEETYNTIWDCSVTGAQLLCKQKIVGSIPTSSTSILSLIGKTAVSKTARYGFESQ